MGQSNKALCVVLGSVPMWLAVLLSSGQCSRAFAADSNFSVSKGQLTFDAEGTEGGPDHSRRLHWPKGASGVTIGRGYDMKLRSVEEVIDDLTKAGVGEELAKKYAQGVLTQSPEEIAKFVKDNGDLTEITAEQQKRLFELVYARYESSVKEIAAKPDVVEKYGAVDWEKLNPVIKDVLVDLCYRGDYTAATREMIQKYVTKNDLGGVAEALAERGGWPNVPCDRFHRRVDYLRAALNNAGKPPSDGDGPARLVFDESQPKAKLYRNAASEKLGTRARKLVSDSRYRPDGDRTRAAEFARDLGKELRGEDLPELQGRVKDQYEQLKTSPFVEKLWVSERLAENERTKLQEARALLEQARDVAKSLAEARKRSDKEKVQKLAEDLAEIQEKVQRKTNCLRLALKEAQTRANNGDQVIVIWKGPQAAGGQGGVEAWVVPTRGTDNDLKPSDDWGKLPLPHIAFAGSKVSGYAPLDAGFASVETIEDLSLFVLKPRKSD